MRSIRYILARAAAHGWFLVASAALAQSALGITRGVSAARPDVFHGGPPASGLPWWAPIAVSVVLLAVALAYVLRHRRPRAPGAPAAESVGGAPVEAAPGPPGSEAPRTLDLAPSRV